jgi:hypothetical protein
VDAGRLSSAGIVAAVGSALAMAESLAVALAVSFTGAVSGPAAAALAVALVARGNRAGTADAAERTSWMSVGRSVAAEVMYVPKVGCHGEAGAGVTGGMAGTGPTIPSLGVANSRQTGPRLGVEKDSAVSRREMTTRGRCAMTVLRRSAPCCYPARVERGGEPCGKDEQRARTGTTPR